MKTELIYSLTHHFEAHAQRADNGVEFWLARDIQHLLGYAEWRNFVAAINKGKTACEVSGHPVSDHFVDVNKMVQLGSGSQRDIDDIMLTRYACYLIAQNGDPRKQEIAFAQTYFAVQTRKAELIEQRLLEAERVSARKKLSETEKELSQVIFEQTGGNQDFAIIRSKGDHALFGKSTQAMKSTWNVPDNRPLADFAPTIILKAKDFATEITIFNTRAHQLDTERAISTEHITNNDAVRNTLLSRGIRPETLPAAKEMIQKSNTEDIEGIVNDEDGSWGDYPIDTFLIRNESRTVHDVLRRIEKGSFVMDPDFQRDFIWPDDKQSKLIESVLLRIPLPVFYLAENPKGQMIVVDGLQRFSTFQRFVNNQLRLKLPAQVELNKKLFQDLSPKLQNRIEDCNLILYVIDTKVPPKALLDIFERVNSGEPLTRQQMRNCLYSGKATQFLKNEVKTELFLQATGDSLKADTMRDREMVNRFCAFQLLGVDGYKGDMDSFLATALEKMNSLPQTELDKLSAQFRNSVKNNHIIFDKYAFRKHTPQQEHRGTFNVSLWDVMTTGLSNYPEHLVEARAASIRNAFYPLLEDKSFDESITLGTNQVAKVKTRFSKVREMLTGVLDD